MVAEELGISDVRLQRHMQSAAGLLGNRAAYISLVHSGVARCIATVGMRRSPSVEAWSSEDAPFRARDLVVLKSPLPTTLRDRSTQLFGNSNPEHFVNLPIIVESELTVSLQTFNQAPEFDLNRQERALLKRLGALMAEDMSKAVHRLIDSKSRVIVPWQLKGLLELCNGAPCYYFIVDRSLNIVAAGQPLIDFLGFPRADIIEKSLLRVFPELRNAAALLVQDALHSGVSSPDFEIGVGVRGAHQLLTMKAVPFRPIDVDSDFLEVRVVPANAAPDSLFNPMYHGFAESFEPSGQFLLDTLAKKRAIHTRNGCNYVTLRSWRNAVKPHQIKALRASKRKPAPEFVSAVGRECADELRQLVGRRTFKAVVPVPCGHSGPEYCLSVAIARFVAFELSLPLINAFQLQSRAGVSHPKENLKRPKMQLVKRVEGPAILIDDVATSGSHIEEASNLLKSNGADVFAMAWIGGNSNG